MRKVFIFPLDGFKTPQSAMDKIEETFTEPDNMIEFISHIKLNDGFHMEEKKKILSFVIKNYPGINIFFDFKLPDTNGTDANILGHYLEYMRVGDIVTVTSNSSLKAFTDIRKTLPTGVKIALVSVLTDTPKEECRARRGMIPEIAILNDAVNLMDLMDSPFDAVVCSPSELDFLTENLPDNMEFLVPCIRDTWMDVGQQAKDRINGVTEALDAGATFLVLGSQLSKGNPGKQITPVKSRIMSIEKALASNAIHLIPDDPLQTLHNLKGYYKTPEDKNGNFVGPLVAYSGTYKGPQGETNYVGDIYFNLAKIEGHSKTLTYFAKLMKKQLRKFEEANNIKINCLVGVPAGGNKIAQETGRLMKLAGIRMEKKVIKPKTDTEKEKFVLVFRRDYGVVRPGDNVVICEDLCNNFSTTKKAISVVEAAGGKVVAISCVANRSKKHQNEWQGIPVVAGIAVPSDQFEQEDERVASLIAEGHLSTDPKGDWKKLKAAMAEG